MDVRINLEIGHEASIRNKRTPQGFTHDWELFVRGCDGAEIHYFIEKVVFHLHESFPKSKRVFKDPPYVIKESGYAGFNFPIDIYLLNKYEPKKITFTYDLTLQPSGPPIYHVQKEKYIFNKPNEEFKSKLIKGGGSVINSSSHDSGESRNNFDKDGQLVSKPKLSGSENTKKHKMRLDDIKNCNNFETLFGPPIKTSKMTESKPASKDVSKSSSSNSSSTKSDKDKDKEKNKNKHSPKDKDKDRERDKFKDKSGDSDRKKDKEEKRNKDRNKERDRSKEKNTKRDKSPRPPSPRRSPKRISSPKRPPSPPPKHKEKEEKREKDSKDKEKRSEEKEKEKSEKKSKKDKRDRDKEHKENKHKDKDTQKSEYKEHKNKEAKISREAVKEVNPSTPPLLPPPPPLNKEKKEKKEKSKEEVKESKKEETIEKLKEKEEKSKHKHKKKDKDRKEKKEEKEKSHKSEKKEKRENRELLKEKEDKTNSLFASPILEPEVKQKPVKPLNALFSEIVDSSSNDSLSSVENTFVEPMPPKPEIKPEPKPEPVLEPKKEVLEPTTSPPVKIKKEKSKKKDKKSDKDSEKRRKRKSSPIEEEPPEKIAKEEPAEVNSDSEQAPVIPQNDISDKSEEYMNILKDLQHKIMSLQDNSELQKVVQLIAETGRYEVSSRTFDFDLCLLERSTVQQLQEFFASTS